MIVMRKKALVLSMLTITILSMLLIPAVLTKKGLNCPTYVEGLWLYIPQILDARVCEYAPDMFNVILETDEVGWFSGGFEGTSYDYPCTVVVHDAEFDGEGNIIGFGSRYYTGIVNYEGMVGDISGRLKMIVVGKQMWGEEWQGTWRIVKGYGLLEHVQGFGTWWGPGFLGGPDPEPGEIWYEGWIH